MLNIIIYIAFIIALFIIVVLFNKAQDTEEINETIKKENKAIEEENKKLEELNQSLQKLKQEKQVTLEIENAKIIEKDKLLKILQEQIDNTKQLSLDAYSSFYENLEHRYNEAEEEYSKKYAELDKERLLRETAIEETQNELNKIKATKAATMEALRKEKEIKDNSAFYCLQFNQSEIRDMKKLSSFKIELNNPRILSMLIWQTFVRDRLKAMTAKILNTTSIVCGIYKITNQITDECYIGQSLNIAKRWSDHVKCGLGIDTPQGNELYSSMQKYGIENFSFELLEKCTKEQLDEKEKYYIELYDSYNFGMNKTKGNK